MARRGLFTQMVVGALFEDHRILTQTAGDHMDVLKLLPPLTVTSEDAAEFLERLRRGHGLHPRQRPARVALRVGADDPGRARGVPAPGAKRS